MRKVIIVPPAKRGTLIYCKKFLFRGQDRVAATKTYNEVQRG